MKELLTWSRWTLVPFSKFLFDWDTWVQCLNVEKQIMILLHFDEFLGRCNLDQFNAGPCELQYQQHQCLILQIQLSCFQYQIWVFFIFYRGSVYSKTKHSPILFNFVKVLLQISIWTLQSNCMILNRLFSSSIFSIFFFFFFFFVYNFCQIF